MRLLSFESRKNVMCDMWPRRRTFSRGRQIKETWPTQSISDKLLMRPCTRQEHLPFKARHGSPQPKELTLGLLAAAAHRSGHLKSDLMIISRSFTLSTVPTVNSPQPWNTVRFSFLRDNNWHLLAIKGRSCSSAQSSTNPVSKLRYLSGDPATLTTPAIQRPVGLSAEARQLANCGSKSGPDADLCGTPFAMSGILKHLDLMLS